MDISMLEYDKFKFTIGLFPKEIVQPNFSMYELKWSLQENYDWYETLDEKYFIPCYQITGPLNDIVCLEEKIISKTNIHEPILKKVTINLKNKFIIGQQKYPSFYGYFSNVRYIKLEWQTHLKDFILSKIFSIERIDDKSLKEQIEHFKIDEIFHKDD